MNKKSETERRKIIASKPYKITTCGRKAAVYNRKYELVSSSADPKLIAYAQKNHTHYSCGFLMSLPEQQPTWMTDNLRERCENYHLFLDAWDTALIKQIPFDLPRDEHDS